MNRTKALPYLGGAITGIVVGIIANLLTPYLPALAASVAHYIATNLLPWIITFILLCIVVILLVTRHQDRNRVNNQLQLADSMLSLLPSFLGNQDLDHGLYRVAQDLLTTAFDSFHFDLRRGVLFLPDAQNEYLIIFAQTRDRNEENDTQEKFYIGPDKTLKNTKGGIAGKVFHTKQFCTCYFMTEQDRIQAMKAGYIYLPHETQGNALNSPPYNSLICLPVPGKQESLGVIAFDSKKAYAFNSPDIREPLDILAKYIAASLMMREELQKQHQATQQATHS